MRLLRLTFILLLLTKTVTLYSQTDSVDVAVNLKNKDQNNQWFDHLKTLNKRQQLAEIQKRLLDDVEKLVYDTVTSYPFNATQGFTIDLSCGQLYRINDKDVVIENPEHAISLVSIIKKTNFKRVEIWKADVAQEKIGKWGVCGVILLTTKNKRIGDELKKMGL